ncbi:Nucleotide-binding universal stress protein, UspA family [Leifsonia sp. 98AMF]|uniref:universal stress protein n=1 Tax=unclassified Leifsonia TaxID=2663824 RepID=UPI00087A0705|nr:MULTISPECIES: universal stress protein [unclassified Leifsonia]SDH63291.1 Nucleotide-binding universal stress protein, UspA family [Leifsonia sp. 197AMF]SDI76022.1 Nucleotide-binding universal stress protein, UspA family [Leifsonia sp. 466MF]SDK11403.1 Nucleotide-binding universal stress protein, UspA family [Leifsonia sp. 157MF]SDN79252.1 Nucleotide-binding universal stress protein, UspA family [Leifsonia sp. 509MF]SEN28308.1 Nucleotide-binding universal stress protein, UspA family [Leifso
MNDGRTVVGFDGTAASWRALDWALDRIERRGGALEIVTALDTRLGAAVFGPHTDLSQTVEAGLREAESHATARAPGVPVRARWVDGPPSGALIRAARDAALLVVGTDRRTDGTGARIGSLPLRLAAKAECAVAVIPDSGASGSPARNAVVVGVDRSPFARSALALAVAEASWLDAEVVAVHAWDVPESFERALDEGREVDPEFAAAESRVVPDAVADVPIAHAARIHPVLVRQNPAAALIEQARDAALLVVGTRGRGAVAAAMLGSVSHDVLLNLPCPVIVTPVEYTYVVPGTDDLI